MTKEWVLINERGELVGHGSKGAMITESVIFARLRKKRWAMTRDYYNTYLSC